MSWSSASAIICLSGTVRATKPVFSVILGFPHISTFTTGKPSTKRAKPRHTQTSAAHVACVLISLQFSQPSGLQDQETKRFAHTLAESAAIRLPTTSLHEAT